MLDQEASLNDIWFAPDVVDVNPPGLTPPPGFHDVAVHWDVRDTRSTPATVALAGSANGEPYLLQPAPLWPMPASPSLNEGFDNSYLLPSLQLAPDTTFGGTLDQRGWTVFSVPNGQRLGQLHVQLPTGQQIDWSLPQG